MDNDTINSLESYFLEYWERVKGIENIHEYEGGKDLKINAFNASMLYIYTNYIYQFRESINNYEYSILSKIINWLMSIQLEFNIVSLNSLLLLCLGGNYKSYIYMCINKGNGNVNNNPYGFRPERATEQTVVLLKSYLDFYQGLATDKLNDNTVGLITNANNNKDMGLMYNRQALADSLALKRCISIDDLPKLE